MAYITKKIGDRYNQPTYYFECDDIADMADIPLLMVPMGSRCFVINEGARYALNSNQEWKLVEDDDDDNNTEEESGGIDVTASIGQTIVVEEVDINGKPTKWKAADLPKGYEDELLGEITFSKEVGPITSTNDESGNVLWYTLDFAGSALEESVNGLVRNLYEMGRPIYAHLEIPGLGKFICPANICGGPSAGITLHFSYVVGLSNHPSESTVMGAFYISGPRLLFTEGAGVTAFEYGLPLIMKIYALH